MLRLLIVLTGTCLLTIHAMPILADDQPVRQAPKVQLGTRAPQFLLSKITVSDLRRSYDFYTQVIGLKWAVHPGAEQPPPPEPQNPPPEFAEIPLNFTGSRADPFFVLVQRRGVAPTREGAGLAVVGFKVADIHAVVGRIKQAGFTVFREPADNPYNLLIAMAYDPDGYQVELLQSDSYASTGN